MAESGEVSFCRRTIHTLATIAIAIAMAGASCRQSESQPARTTVTPASSPVSEPTADLPAWRLPPVERLIAVGDLHGDLTATRDALRLAGVLDTNDHWSGGTTTVVQTGDQLDRGTEERELLDFLERLTGEARQAGGALHVLNGNHEFMNAEGDFRYVPPAGFEDFAIYASAAAGVAALGDVPSAQRARAFAFRPGGPLARRFASHNTVMVVGETAFVHGGLLASHVDHGIEAINLEARQYFLGTAALSSVLQSEDGPVWNRQFALRGDPDTCMALRHTLDALHVQRLVLGHTVQEQGVNAACDNTVWRIDAGLARLYRTPNVQVLEIKNGTDVKILSRSR